MNTVYNIHVFYESRFIYELFHAMEIFYDINVKINLIHISNMRDNNIDNSDIDCLLLEDLACLKKKDRLFLSQIEKSAIHEVYRID